MFYKPNTIKFSHSRILKLWLKDLSLVFFNTYSNLYLIPKTLKYTAAFLSIINESQCVPLLSLSSRFMTHTPSFVLGNLSLEKTLLNLGLSLKCLGISILLKGWSGTKNFYPYGP